METYYSSSIENEGGQSKVQSYLTYNEESNDTLLNDTAMNLEYFHRHKIIYEEYPWSDKPDFETPDYMYFKNGTRQYVRVFVPGRKLYNAKAFNAAMCRLKYLNPNIDYKIFHRCGRIMGNKENNFAIFTMKDKTIAGICEKIHAYDDNFVPKLPLRKLIFKQGNNLTLKEKQSIIGTMCGGFGGTVGNQNARKIDSTDVYEAMLQINDLGEKITNARLIEILNVTKRTIQRNKTEELNKEILILNSNLNM